jgi:hypothetical protein
MLPPRPPALRFSPYAWAKLLFLRDRGPTEVAALAVSAPGDLLLVEDLHLVNQEATAVTVRFDDEAVADFLDECVQEGLQVSQCFRIWAHTHPSDDPTPSWTDEATFLRCFGTQDWALMFILSRTGRTYARIRFSAGPGGQAELPVEVDFTSAFRGSRHAEWAEEYDRCVRPVPAPFALFSKEEGPLLREPRSDEDEWWGRHADDLWEPLEELDAYAYYG